MGQQYEPVTLPTARRALKKLPVAVRQHLKKEVQPLTTNPYSHEKLEGNLGFLRSFHMTYKKTQYRVVYEIDEDKKQVVIYYAASRENFYRTLEQLKLKPSA